MSQMSHFRPASAFSPEYPAPPTAPLLTPPHLIQQTGSNIRGGITHTSTYNYNDRHGNLSSFLCHVLYLEKRLQDEEGLGGFIDNKVDHVIGRTKLGEGSQFTVFSSQIIFKRPMRHLKANDPGQIVAVKVVKPKVPEECNYMLHNWSSVLFEVRALMHEYLRYHPNIVRLLGFTWAPGWNSSPGSMYPMLVMEYARYGSLRSLQALSPPLSFAVKQKLCHDVARGLSMLHACGIIHGDLNRENVLVFDNPYDHPPRQPFLAKLADFGGAAMDTKFVPSQSLRLHTSPYDAPEALLKLTANGLKKMDIYSFGLLFWQALLDGKDLVKELGLGGASEPYIVMRNLKKNDERMLNRVLDSICEHFPPGTARETLELIAFTLRRTIRTDPADRHLAAAQAALRVGHVRGIVEHLQGMETRNSNESFEYQDGIKRRAFNVDRVGFQLGKEGDFYDAQQNLPGYRSELPHPAAGKFLFEPMKAKSLLSWEQQVKIVNELKAAARAEDEVSLLGIPPFKAAFYIFQAYLAEFGVVFDAKEVCYWLKLAAEPDDQWEEEMFAQAWLWRVCEALQCLQPVSIDTSIQYLSNSIVYGFKDCERDWESYIETLTDAPEKQNQTKELKNYQSLMRTYAGGVGMMHYFPSSIRKKYNLSDVHVLDQQIREELGEQYERYLQMTDLAKFETPDEVSNRFDKIYVSNAGHGLLHFAATFGNAHVLEHLLDTYRCDINRGSSFKGDSPLLCAVRSAQYDCAMFLLDRGAQAGIIQSGEEGPLHWVCGFEKEQEEEMRNVASRLINAGADINELSTIDGSRGIAADWDSLLNIPTTPLGRAVIARNDGAIKVLLDLGADPRGKGGSQNEKTMSPMEIAAVLFYPKVLQTLLERINEYPDIDLFDEAWVLEAAHKRKKDSVDPSCLQSRLVRLGSQYKSAILDTFRLIRSSSTTGNDLLYKEVSLGDADIVEALLELGHDPNGNMKFRPLEAAASTRNEPMFKMLLRFGADPLLRYLQPLHDVQMTFLHAITFSAQGARTADGVKIAEQLLAAGVSVEERPEQCPITPFALCVTNRFFDIADLLLAHGARLNPVFAQPLSQGPLMSLLGSLVMSPSEAALESIHYLITGQLLKKPPDGSIEGTPAGERSGSCLTQQMHRLRLLPTNPSPIGIPSHSFNVLHQIAHWMDNTVTYNRQASIDIMSLLLFAFDDPAIINERCPEVGTPLSIAAMYLNFNFVEMLLEKKADPSIDFDVARLNRLAREAGVERTYIRGTPLYGSLFTYEGILVGFEKGFPDNGDPGLLARVEHLFTIAEKTVKLLLPLYQDEGAFQLWKDLQVRSDALLTALRQARDYRKIMVQGDDGRPVDLSGLTEEMPVHLEEGCDMTDVMALRTFLKYFRKTDFVWPDP